mgnify:FL=1
MLGKKACSVVVSSLMVFEMTGFGSLAYAVESKDGDSDVAQETTLNLDAENQGQSESEGGEAVAQAADADVSDVVPGADAPTSPTNASTHLDITAADLLSESELSAAYSKRMARSAWDYSSATFADVLVYAEQYIGLPYVWGGKDLYRDGGFDCSGFVNWVYNNVCGTNINSDWTNAQSLYDGYCMPVSEAEARPGDIIFWKGTYQSLGYISHVGIYCGNGICIDAGDPIGYDHVTDIRNMNGVPAERVYGRLVSLSSTSVDLNAAITKVRVADQAYTGGACTPSPTVVSAGSVLNEGTDYWVSYENNVNVGTATIVIHGAGRFGGQETRKNFQIYEDSFEGGARVVSSALNPSQVLDVPSGSLDSGVAMQLYSRNDTDAQTFEFEKTGDGYYAIRNMKSGLYLSLYTTWAELRNGTAVTQQSWYGGLSQKWCVKPVGNGQYIISSAMDCSMVLDVSNGVASNGSVVQAYSDNGTAAQRWSFEPAKTVRQRVDELAAANAGTVAAGTYSVASALSSGSVLDAAGAGTADGTAAQVYSANGTDAQAWVVEDAGAGYVTVRNAASGLALDVPGADASSGAQLQLWTPNGSWAQKWVAVRDGSGIRLVSALSDSLSVDLPGASTADGSRLQLYSDNGTAAQRWSFVTPGCTQVVPNGVYVIKSAMNQNYVLDIDGASDANGANAQLYEANGTGAQAFALTWSNGYYAISNVSSGKYLDLENGSNQNGANVQQQGTFVRDSARWSLVGNPDGSFVFVNFASGTCMTVASPSAENYSNVQGAVRTGATGQKWFLEKSPLSAETVSYGITLKSMSILNGGSGAANDAVTIALNPDIVQRGDDYYYQFADCRGFTGQISANQMNRIIDNSGTGRNGVFSGRGQAIIAAAKSANINEMYLMAHIMTETAWGTSDQAQGRDFAAGNATIKLNGKYYTKWCDAGRYYNFIGWGAYDSNPDTAYDFSRYYGWNSIESALMGAAEKVASNYLYNGQETVYEMRWNPDAASFGRVHQYCTDINWARTISSIMGYNYRLVGVMPSLSYRVPKYM